MKVFSGFIKVFLYSLITLTKGYSMLSNTTEYTPLDSLEISMVCFCSFMVPVILLCLGNQLS